MKKVLSLLLALSLVFGVIYSTGAFTVTASDDVNTEDSYGIQIVNNDNYEPAKHDDDALETDDDETEDDNSESTVEEGSELAKKTRAELADLDDLDI